MDVRRRPSAPKPIAGRDADAVRPPEGAREWTAEIRRDGRVLYAWMAYSPATGTFATDRLEHARLFRTEADVERWIRGLEIEGASPARVRGGRVAGNPAPRKG